MPTWLGTTSNSWNLPANWDTNAVPTAATDAIFSSANNNPCNVDVVGGAVCRNLRFDGGTGYTSTITMTNGITVGNTTGADPNQTVVLSSGMIINPAGTGAITVRANGITTLTSNGKQWPNAFNLNTLQVSSTSTVILTDSWVVGSLSLGPAASHALTMQGAFNFTVNGNFTVNPVGTGGRVNATTGAVTTFILAGNGTWSTSATFATAATSPKGFGPNITINAPGKNITIADNCYYGGEGTDATSAFTYTAGIVTTAGTFYLIGSTNAFSTYTVNVNGSISPSATLVNNSGINFNNLAIRSYGVSQPQIITISGNICAVGDVSLNSLSTTGKAPINTTGGTIYANKGLLVGYAYMRNASNTVVKLQGTGTWSDVATTAGISLGALMGLTWQIEVTTTGTITVGSTVALSAAGKLKYVTGSFVSTGQYIYLTGNSTVEDFGSGGVTIFGVTHYTDGAIGSANAVINFVDTVPIKITNLNFAGFSGTNSFVHAGTIGWTCDNFNYQPTVAASNFTLQLTAKVGIEYKVTTSFIMRHFKAPALITPNAVTCNLTIAAGNTIPRAILTIMPGASQDVYAVDSRNMDSSGGQTVWNRKGLLVNTVNWDLWDYPRTRYATFSL